MTWLLRDWTNPHCRRLYFTRRRSIWSGQSRDDQMAVAVEQTTQLLRDHLRLSNLTDDGAQEWSWFLAPSPLGGRGLVAGRNICAGEVVFQDSPLVVGPRAGVQCPPLCVGCHQGRDLKPCSQGCGLPVCSAQCEGADTHLFECQKLRSWGVRTNGTWSPELLRASVPVRCLALNSTQRQLLYCMQRNRGSQHAFEVPLSSCLRLRTVWSLSATSGGHMLRSPCPASNGNAKRSPKPPRIEEHKILRQCDENINTEYCACPRRILRPARRQSRTVREGAIAY
jgi:hypothetical protein